MLRLLKVEKTAYHQPNLGKKKNGTVLHFEPLNHVRQLNQT